ncbi:MAG: YdcF family protein [Clostridiales bacterium]|nr:YdcF family protein [Clostridiales bacterium]
MSKFKEILRQIKHKKLILLIIILVVLATYSFPRLGNWLVSEEEISEGDVIVVLMGSVPDRILEAVDIYNEGYSEKIIMVNSHMVGYDALLSRGVTIPGDAQLAVMAATALDVPEEDLLIIKGEAKSTQDEALIVREYLKENKDINNIILVTSKYHSSRSKKIFTKALDKLDRDVNVISRPSRYDNFDAKMWWKDREDIARVVTEYLKYLNYYLREQFQL